MSTPLTRLARARTLAFILASTATAGFAAPAALAEEVPVTPEAYCGAWEEASNGSETLTLNGLEVTGSRVIRSGNTCHEGGSQITVENAQFSEVARGSGGNATAKIAAAVTTALNSNDLQEGDEVFRGASVDGITAVLSGDWSHFVIRGGLTIAWSGGTQTKLQFGGRLYGTENYVLNLHSPEGGTSLPNIGGDPITFEGSYERRGSYGKLALTGSAPSLIIGSGNQQLSVSDGTLDVSLVDDQADGNLRASVAGVIGLGQHVRANGALALEFDADGLAKASGDGQLELTVPAAGNVPEINVNGGAEFSYTRNPAARSIGFDGSVRVGDGLTASASGTIDDAAITFNGSVALTGANIAIEGGADGVLFYGDNLSGRTIQNRAGQQVPASKGDVLIRSAGGKVSTNGLELAGDVQYGKVGSQEWATANGSLDLSANGSTVKGSATLSWIAPSSTIVSFDGSIKSGGLDASARGIVDGKKLTFIGQATLTDGATSISGAIDGSYYYGNDLSGETVKTRSGATVQPNKGDYVLRSASGQIKARGLDLSGAVSLGRVGGEQWATGSGAVDINASGTAIKGSASFTWIQGGSTSVTFDGSIVNGSTKLQGSGTVDEKKIALSGSLSTPQVSGSASGVVFHGSNLAGETITNRSGTIVPASRGDFAFTVRDGRATLGNVVATADFTASKVGSLTWVKTSAQLKVSRSWLAFDGEIDSTGTFNLKGSGSVDFDGTWVDFVGEARLNGGKLVIYGSGQLRTDLFAVQVSGTIEKPNAEGSTYVLTGKANFKFGKFSIANGVVRIATGEGLSTNFDLKVCLLFLCSNGKVKLYFQGGKVSKAELRAPLTLVAPLRVLVGGALPKVPIDTTIRGIL